MTKIIAAVCSAAFLLAGGSALAEGMGKDPKAGQEMKKDAMKQDSMAKDKKAGTKKDTMAKKDMAKDKMNK